MIRRKLGSRQIAIVREIKGMDITYTNVEIKDNKLSTRAKLLIAIAIIVANMETFLAMSFYCSSGLSVQSLLTS